MARHLFNRTTLVDDLSAGLTLGFFSVPDGMATGLLALINPIHGVYGYMVGVFTGAFFTSSVYMSVQATSAMALIVAGIPQIHEGGLATDYLLALTLLTGVVMVVLGVLKLGSLMRFVPKSVMTGFINAVAILIVLGQLADLTGYSAAGSNRIVQTFNLARNLNQIDLPSLFVGLTTIILILVLEKTKLSSFGIVAAMIIASLLPPIFNWSSVALASSIAVIPSELPRVVLPQLSTFLPMIVPALALALVGLVQGSGISQSYANPDGKYADASGDFTGQGIANIAAGLLQGMPVGGSLSATSLVVNSGAKTRLANIIAGITMALSLLLLGGLIGSLAMPALAGLLIVIGFRTLKPVDVRMVWNTGFIQAIVMVVTFTTAFFIPLHFAVLVGVALSIFLFAFQRSNRIVIKEWRHTPGEFPSEAAAPTVLPSNRITILVPYGSLFFASAQGFEVQLPTVSEETHNAAVVLNFRGHTDFGSTFLTVLKRYALELRARNSRLILSGVGRQSLAELEKTGLINLFERHNIFIATDRIGESLFAAHADAEAWLEQRLDRGSP